MEEHSKKETRCLCRSADGPNAACVCESSEWFASLHWPLFASTKPDGMQVFFCTVSTCGVGGSRETSQRVLAGCHLMR